jgi:hypothetical protein
MQYFCTSTCAIAVGARSPRRTTSLGIAVLTRRNAAEAAPVFLARAWPARSQPVASGVAPARSHRAKMTRGGGGGHGSERSGTRASSCCSTRGEPLTL